MGRCGANAGYDEYRSAGSGPFGANSGHFNVNQKTLNPVASVPQAQGNMHFGEQSPLGLGVFEHLCCEAPQ